MSALDVALDASGLAAEVASHSACAPLFGVRRADAFDAEDCLRFNDALAKMAVARTGEIDKSEEHTSELQSLMRISYAVFCLKKKKNNYNTYKKYHTHHR